MKHAILLAAAGLWLSASPAANADVRFTTHVTIDGPQMRGMSQRAMIMMDRTSALTISLSGRKARYDSSTTSLIADVTLGRMTTLYHQGHTYGTGKLDVTKATRLMVEGPNPTANTKKDKLKVKDVGPAADVLGHKCHEYSVTYTTDSIGGTVPCAVTDDLIIATDLSGFDLKGFNPFADYIGTGKIHGVPLINTITLHGGPLDGTVVKTQVSEISTDPLPASTFDIPAGYTVSDPATPTGSARTESRDLPSAP